MKRLIVIIISIFMILSLFACSNQEQELVNMTSGTYDGVSTVVWGDKIYVPYGSLAIYGDRGKQIGIIDSDNGHKVYECNGYSTDEWIAAALPYDAAMLYREINVTDIPESWQSEYEWNN